LNLKATFTSNWLNDYIRQHGGVMTITTELVLD